ERRVEVGRERLERGRPCECSGRKRERDQRDDDADDGEHGSPLVASDGPTLLLFIAAERGERPVPLYPRFTYRSQKLHGLSGSFRVTWRTFEQALGSSPQRSQRRS